MQAMIIETLGSSEVFKQKSIVKPQVVPGHVLIQVKATSVNALDFKIRNNTLGDICVTSQ